MGACLYTLIYGRIPFSAPNLYKLFQVVQNEPVKYPVCGL
jgi:[calcium/calmodulin-dependent protein kinase] kinase